MDFARTSKISGRKAGLHTGLSLGVLSYIGYYFTLHNTSSFRYKYFPKYTVAKIKKG